ncbi:MAG TPA: VOC family protein [Acidobacteriaceae bacterium]|nr:VOC family protein [Acidobacteriaceae bacterium]
MRILSFLALVCVLAGSASAEMPSFYRTVNRVTWLVQNVDLAKQGWIQLGMSDIHEYPDVVITGQDHGKPVKMWAWEITGHLGNLTVDMIQPAEGQLNSWNDFLGNHGDGIFSIVHEVPTMAAMNQEIKRMQSLGVGVLQQLSFERDGKRVTFTYFDTEPQGKFVLGLVYWPGGAPPAGPPGKVSHLAPVIREAAPVSAYWQKLGFPALRMEHATPRKDSTYRGKPLWFAFEVGYQNYTQFSYEWIIPPMTPPNIYADFLNKHKEGIQHIGMPVDDLNKAVAEYEKLGYHVWQSGAWGDVGKKDSGQYDYMDTDSIGGVVVELIHAYK